MELQQANGREKHRLSKETRGFTGKAAPQQFSHWREGETLNEEQRGTDMEFVQSLGGGRSELLRRYLHVVGREGRGARRYLHGTYKWVEQDSPKTSGHRNLQEHPRSP